MKEEEGAIHQQWWRRKIEQFTNSDEGGRRSHSPTVMKKEDGATHQQWWRKREQLTNCDDGRRGATHQQWWRKKGEQLTNRDEGRGNNSPTGMMEEGEQLTNWDDGRRGATHQQGWRKKGEQLTNSDEGRGSHQVLNGCLHGLSQSQQRSTAHGGGGLTHTCHTVRSSHHHGNKHYHNTTHTCHTLSSYHPYLSHTIIIPPIPVTQSGPVITMATNTIIIPPISVTHYHHTTHTCHTVRSVIIMATRTLIIPPTPVTQSGQSSLWQQELS